jgi:ParB-like chromosome segregation protein Spo0J
MATNAPWRSRIVGHGEEAPDQLLANPLNFRVHPKPQQGALAGVLDEVGWVQDVIVNQQTGHVIDGHLRVSLAISRNEPSIPVVYVDLNEAEEKLILATIDPLSAMAATDAEKLDELLRADDARGSGEGRRHQLRIRAAGRRPWT